MIKHYDCGIFPRMLVLADSLDEVIDSGDYECVDEDGFSKRDEAVATTYHANYGDRGCAVLVIFRPVSIGAIAHESLHITRTIIEHLPCELCEETEEVWGYAVGWCADRIFEFCKERELLDVNLK